jgi:tetratricopeptide (TPR) repeat protein
MRFVYALFILLRILIPSVQCQQTAGDWFDKGTILGFQGRYDEAIKAFDEAIRLDPKDAAP